MFTRVCHMTSDVSNYHCWSLLHFSENFHTYSKVTEKDQDNPLFPDSILKCQAEAGDQESHTGLPSDIRSLLEPSICCHQVWWQEAGLEAE